MAGSKNLIMGLWMNLPFEPLESFLASLRRTSFDGDVCIFVDNVPAATVRALQAYNVIVERAARFSLPHFNWMSSRFYCYQDFLARHGGEYAKVMITDLRDVLFQVDPFSLPWPADLIFAQERRRISDCPTNRTWIVQTYGEAMLDNLRHCMVSCAGTTFGTVQAMHQYLGMMTSELANRPIPIHTGLDQSVHNYLVRMRPISNAWCDPTDSFVATMSYVPDDAIRITEQGVLVDGRLVPVIHQWDRKPAIRAYIDSAPQFKLRPQPELNYPIVRQHQGNSAQQAATFDAIICFYHRQRDAEWMRPFLATLRAVGFQGDIHCVGELDAAEHAIITRFAALAHPIESSDGSIDVDNLAHLCVSRILDEIAAGAMLPDQVLVLDTMRAGFLRHPFLGKTIGLSLFYEGSERLGRSDYNLHRLALFTDIDDTLREHPVISSAALRGKLQTARRFYRKLLTEFVGKEQLLRVPKAIQGAFNKLGHDTTMGFPVIIHPNAAEVYFEIGDQTLIVEENRGLRVGGTVPAIVVSPFAQTPLMGRLKASLRL